ncbi:hypothetical protein [Streptomyces collinus]
MPRAGWSAEPVAPPPYAERAGADRMIAGLVRSRDTPDEVVEAARLH